MEQQEVVQPKERPFSDIASVAAGMLRDDWKLLPLIYLLMVLPRVTSNLLLPISSDWTLLVRVLERVIYLLVFVTVGKRWINRFAVDKKIEPSALLIIMIGMAFWLFYMLPIISQFSNWNNEAKLLTVIWLIPAILINLRYYFYFMPLLMGRKDIKSCFRDAAIYTDKNRWLGVKCCLGPAGLMFLATAIVQGISPDGRLVAVNVFSDFISASWWLLSTYISLAAGFLTLPDANWSELGLEPYRGSRFSTLAVRGNSWLRSLLTPNKGFIMLVLGSMVWAGNLLRLSEMPPSANIQVLSVGVEGSKVSVLLKATDSEFNFRGFTPIFFALASERRTPLAPFPSKVTISNNGLDAMFSIPGAQAEIQLVVEFETSRDEKSILALEDINLWYRNSKIQKLDLAAAKQGGQSDSLSESRSSELEKSTEVDSRQISLPENIEVQKLSALFPVDRYINDYPPAYYADFLALPNANLPT